MIRSLLMPALIALSFSSVSMGQSAFVVADTQLNENYQAVMKLLPASNQEALRDAQRLWIRYTDANCEFKVALDEQQFETCKLEDTLKRSSELARLSMMMREGTIADVAPEFIDYLKDVLGNLESIPTKPSEGIYWPGGSAHTIATQLLKKIGVNYVVNQYGKPIYLEGPHTKTTMNLESSSQFGHYDPAFLMWLDQHLDALLADTDFVASTQSVVDRYLLGTVELYLLSYYYLINNPQIRDEMLLDYMVQYQNASLEANHHGAFFVPSLRKENPHWDGEKKSERYIWYYPEATTQFDWILTNLNERWEYMPVGSSLFFWMRRSMDGTDQQFVDLLTKFYRGYDPETLKKIERQNFTAPKDLPFGDIKF